ncbi:MAG: rRNA cytosine-C5-methyltransferase [Bacteroides sp.]|nr:rRNA cytosine-C5-methyltransferase [Bacteroides sp.]
MILPQPFIERTRQLLGDEYPMFEQALQCEVPVSVRPNPLKCALPIEGEAVPWAPSGVYLRNRPTFTFDPLFHAGGYYVQEASSMFVERVLQTYVHEPVTMLDLCAAPGGKSTLARSILPEGSLLVANEVMRNRSQVLAENLIKWGHPEVVVTNNDPADFTSLAHLFDVILTDVPCSGEGMFRKDETAVSEWSIDNVDVCWRRQRRILNDIWPALKPGGLLIYSTCTFNREEDEDNVAWIARELGAEVLPVSVDDAWGITGNLIGEAFPVYRFLPHRTKGEGFFLAVLRKLCSTDDKTMFYEAENYVLRARTHKPKKGKEAKGRTPTASVPKETVGWLKESGVFRIEMKENTAIAFPKAHAETYALLQETLKVIHAGITLGETKGKDFIPHHSLAMSVAREDTAFPKAELTYQQAIAYLRKEGLVLDASVPRGYVLVTYRDLPLGFVKNIGNRANNLYPQEWRIRSGYLPEELSFVYS